MGKQKQLTKQRLVLGIASLGVVGLALTALACPSTNQAYADDMTTTEDAKTITRVAVRPVLAVSLSPTVTIDLAPKASGSYSSSVAELKVFTNSRNGFAILMNGVNGTDLTSTRGGQDKIATISKTSTLANFPANTWGYYIGEQAPVESSQFNSIPEVSTEIKSTTTSSDNQTYKVAFGTKIDTNLEAGLYSNEVLISVVANPVEVMGLQDLYYMQDMTPEICAATTSLEVTKELVDIRDNKTYKVAKLKDGNCWMQENLALNLSTNMTLTPADSDVTRNWTPTENTRTTISNNQNNNGLSSWSLTASNLGQQFYYQFNTLTAGTGQSVTNDGGAATDSICPKGWKLPLSGIKNDTVSGSFQYLLNKYKATTVNAVTSMPLSFTRSGSVYQGTLQQINTDGSYPSRNSASSAAAYRFYFGNNGGFRLSYPGDRPTGVPVRCVTISSSV